jgi:GT2 family glycosyltransferase
MPAPKILIIIVTWNKKEYVLDLLASIANLDYLGDLDIVVVDNASNDATVAAIQATYPQVHLICHTENLGGTGGFNAGLKWAYTQDKYDYLWLLDNDVVVHKRALIELVNVLQQQPDIAVVGSTMLQLDYPWRINEMGAYIDYQRKLGQFILNRHLEPISAWMGQPVAKLIQSEADLSNLLPHCHAIMDVDYVAAASLLVRAEVAKQAGLWRDYFIHYDDVEWCLRIADLGHRVTVSAKSLIWHLSAAAKVPTWILYYDNRNVLDMLSQHGLNPKQIKQLKRHILKKAVYYHLIGKSDLAGLHQQAVVDFTLQNMGKKEIKLTTLTQPHSAILDILSQPKIKKVLVAYPVNLIVMNIQVYFRQAQLARPELKIEFMPMPPDGNLVYQLPRPHFIRAIPRRFIPRWWRYWNMRGNYDLVVQSDYKPVIGLAILKAQQLYVNDENCSLRPSADLTAVWNAAWRWLLYGINRD